MPRDPSTSWAMKPANAMAIRVGTVPPGTPGHSALAHKSHRFSGINGNSGPCSRQSVNRVDSSSASDRPPDAARTSPPRFAARAGTNDDGRLEVADPLDRERDEVARLEPPPERRVLDLEQAAGARPSRSRAARPAARARPPTRGRASARTSSARVDHEPRETSTVRPSAPTTVAVIVRSGAHSHPSTPAIRRARRA